MRCQVRSLSPVLTGQNIWSAFKLSNGNKGYTADISTNNSKSSPPIAVRKPVTHSLHGHDRPDDFLWLKTQGKQDTEVLEYVTAENDYFASVMQPHADLQQEIYDELRSHVQGNNDAPPVKEGGYDLSA